MAPNWFCTSDLVIGLLRTLKGNCSTGLPSCHRLGSSAWVRAPGFERWSARLVRRRDFRSKAGQVLAGSFAGQPVTLPSLLGQELKIDGSGEVQTVIGVRITNTDVDASNGVIHIIDQVLVPKT
ncbi:MAG: hypothetical protein C0511_12945 [Hyphomicrobium sp.]|nr:hypothetical protein [Hyphomicrobium sp.]